MRGRCTLLLNVLLYTFLSSQEIQFSFKHFNTDQGLASNQANTIVQDSQGYIWIGTSNGLQRYDGIRFLNFKHDQKNERAIPSNVIGNLYFMHPNRLWMISGEGEVGIFDTRKLAFRKVEVYKGGKKGELLPEGRFLGDARGNIFILGIRGGLYIWNEQKGHFHTYAFPPPASEDWQVTGLTPLPGTTDYILSFGAEGLFLLHTTEGDWNDGQVVLKPVLLPGYPKGLKAYNLLADEKGRLWAQFWPSLYHTPKIYSFSLSRQSVLVSDYEPGDLVKGYIETAPFFQSDDGTVWVYGANIFARYDEELDTFQLVHNGYTSGRPIFYQSIKCLFEDRENTIWVGTNDNGIYTFNPDREYFRNISHINHHTKRHGRGSPTDFLQLADSTILVSVWGDGLYRYDTQWNELPFEYSGAPELARYSIWSMCRSRRKGIIWLSSQPGRIFRYDELAGHAEAFRNEMVENHTIRQVVEDGRGDLWLGMQNIGVLHWECGPKGRPEERGISKFQSIPDCTINKIVVGRNGWLWVATQNRGLYIIDPLAGRVALHLDHTHEDPERRLPDSGVSSVLDYNDSLVLISGLSSLQVFNRNQGTLALVNIGEALAGYIADLAIGRAGNVWISTTSGLYRADIQNASLLKFGRSDGIDDEDFTLASSYTLSDGRMLFGASESFVVFDPAIFNTIENDRPEATLTTLQINNRPVLVDSVEEAGGLQLRHYESALSMEFSTLQYYRSSNIRYKMEGLDQDWQANENNIAIYSYLPAGSYRFLLQPIYADGTLGPIRALHIMRNPPFWLAWWFYSILCLAVGGLIYLFDQERVRRRKSIQQMRASIADHLHAEIRTALNSIHILSEMAAIKARKDPAKATNYLGQINSKSQQMMHVMEDMLWAVAPENDNMSKVVERIKTFVHNLHIEGRADVSLLVSEEVGALQFDMRSRQWLLRLAKESVNGLLKAGARHLQVYLGWDKMQLSYVIEFDKAEVDSTILNNLLQAEEMAALLVDMGAAYQLEIHRVKGALSFGIPF